MKKTILYNYLVAATFLLTACTEDTLPDGGGMRELPVTLAAEYPVRTQTRATDNGFSNGDKVGIFIVDYENGEAGEALLSGNRASNVFFTYDEAAGRWSAPMTLYWAADGTPADIIGYYPYVENLQSMTAQPFTIANDQTTSATAQQKGGYEQSDMLWAKAERVSPTSETVTLSYSHVMAGVSIRLEQGGGFTPDEWARIEKTVLVTSTLTKGTIDLTTGVTGLDTSADSGMAITALYYGDAWRAVVLPQTVDGGKPLVSITIDGQSYELKKETAMTYLAGRMHQFTITVNRRSPAGDYELLLADEAIVPWEDDAAMHDGLTRAYVVADVQTAGTLRQVIQQMGLDYDAISNLKVMGHINRDDLLFMGQEMVQLTNLNLQKALITDSVLTGFKGHSLLYHIVMPESGLTSIGAEGFMDTGLSGNLTIPEGVRKIGFNAFYNCKFTGTLSLPSSLRELYDGAFYNCRFKGDFLLPDEVQFVRHSREDSEEITYRPVFGTDYDFCNFTGTLHLPSGLRTFMGMRFPKMTGDIIIPQGVTEIESLESDKSGWFGASEMGIFANGGYDGTVTIPEGVTRIGMGTFAHTKIRGEVNLPTTLRILEKSAFTDTRISRVNFGDNIMVVGNYCFENCQYLSGTVTWPSRCTRIPKGVFRNCHLLSGIVIPKHVTVIEDLAFEACSNLTTIVLECEEPPLFGGNDVFLGVSRQNAIVQVPPSAVEKYKQAEGWSSFLHIIASSDFECLPSKVSALNKGHDETLMLYAGTEDWTVVHQPSWCRLSQTRGTGKTELVLSLEPMPHGSLDRSDSIVFRMEGSEGFTTICKVSQYDYQYEEDACLTLQKHSRGTGIDIAFVGDGFDAASISDGSYLELVKYQTECFFAIEPYRSMRDYFNVYVTFPLSQEKGVNTMYTYVNNRFGTLYGQSSLGGCTSGSIITETDDVRNYVLTHTPMQADGLPRSLVILVPNTTDYGGNTVIDDSGFAISICPPSESDYPRDTRGTIQHEAGGHGFGKLGDENISKVLTANDEDKWFVIDMHYRGWWQNLSTTGKLNEVPWAEFIFDPDFSDHVDVFEGGYGFLRGIYRPESNSCMNYGIPYYNMPSRLDIWKRIKEYAGEPWTMDEFRRQDTFEWGPQIMTRSTIEDISGCGYAESNRHVAPLVTDFKKMGREVRLIREKMRKKTEKQ